MFHFIELPKFSNSKINIKDKLDQWLLFIEDRRKLLIEKAIQENKYIKEADENMKKLKRDGYSEYKAWLREKYYIEMNGARATGYREGMEEGIEKGIEEGIERGKVEGINEEKEKTIKKLTKLGYSEEQIAEITEMNIEKVREILNNLTQKV